MPRGLSTDVARISICLVAKEFMSILREPY
jgi:hypothetical protein